MNSKAFVTPLLGALLNPNMAQDLQPDERHQMAGDLEEKCEALLISVLVLYNDCLC